MQYVSPIHIFVTLSIRHALNVDPITLAPLDKFGCSDGGVA
jgi:hypothetical protein